MFSTLARYALCPACFVMFKYTVGRRNRATTFSYLRQLATLALAYDLWLPRLIYIINYDIRKELKPGVFKLMLIPICLYLIKTREYSVTVGSLFRGLRAVAWPLHNIGITNSVWCMAYGGGSVVGGRTLCKGRAIVLQYGWRCRWAGQYTDDRLPQ